jgi:hypothetical protein
MNYTTTTMTTTLLIINNKREHYMIQTSSGAHPASCPMGTGGSFPGGKAARREAEHSPPASAEVKKVWIYTSAPPYTFMV